MVGKAGWMAGLRFEGVGMVGMQIGQLSPLRNILNLEELQPFLPFHLPLLV